MHAVCTCCFTSWLVWYDLFKTICHNQPKIMTSSTWEQLVWRLWDFCQTALNVRRATKYCMEQSRYFRKVWRFSRHTGVHAQSSFVQWLQQSWELDGKSCAEFWRSYSHQLRIAQCRYQLMRQAGQDAEGNGGIRITTWLYGNTNMYDMASQSFSEYQTEADLFYNYHLDLQECMQDPIAFHAEMMDDIMHFHQAT